MSNRRCLVIGGGGLIGSGTYACVCRAIGIGMVTHGLAMSWESPVDMWLSHSGHMLSSDSGQVAWIAQAAADLVRQAIEQDLWGAQILNVNFPAQASHEVVFTKPIPDIGVYYTTSVALDKVAHTFEHPMSSADSVSIAPAYDVGAIQEGKISVTPCRADMLDVGVYERVKGEGFLLG